MKSMHNWMDFVFQHNQSQSNKLEKIQRVDAKMVPSLRNLYEERLEKQKLLYEQEGRGRFNHDIQSCKWTEMNVCIRFVDKD